ncbi:glycosyltransferase [Pelotalea chapellei]|uniref:Glycosyltransferase family 2 protein n=1 Tax=Pelotalea chapellei TaxID=44671 RepID=A0ABS5U5N5_9BACT|nr:glycosyltransferase family 2 protein [Pelotalea chapellei]MBT1070962.1 glycosyltransferase family 2 protein [Pelotalea chapellei]
MIGLHCTASIVVYNNPPDMIRKVVGSLLSPTLSIELHIIDNSETPTLKSFLTDLPVKYYFCNNNLGYGEGHNRIINNGLSSKYHIIINPDIIIEPTTIEILYTFMDNNSDIGIVSPKILNPDGTTQFLNRRHPTFYNLFARRFVPTLLLPLIKDKLDHYEMKDIGYEEVCDVEFLTGCFMFCRTDALTTLGGFDSRYFMYLEDADLSRKMQMAGYRTVFNPNTSITHLWERSSYKNIKMTLIHMRSAFAYLHKWGWGF